MGAIEIKVHLDAEFGSISECLHDRPVGEDVCDQVDFMLGMADLRHVDMVESLCRRVMNRTARDQLNTAPARLAREWQ